MQINHSDKKTILTTISANMNTYTLLILHRIFTRAALVNISEIYPLIMDLIPGTVFSHAFSLAVPRICLQSSGLLFIVNTLILQILEHIFDGTCIDKNKKKRQ